MRLQSSPLAVRYVAPSHSEPNDPLKNPSRDPSDTPWTGNKRLDTLQNVVATGRAGLLSVIPGRTTTLSVNGRACVSTRRELLSQPTAVGEPPASALVLGIEEVCPHCPKSLLRSGAWKPEQWLPADAQPTSAEVTLVQLRMPELTIADIEQAEADSLKYRYE